MLRDILKPLSEATMRAGVTIDEVLALGADGLTDFMLDLPSRAGLLELAWQQHANSDTRWEANDLNDLVFLSVAVGYCDIVVTERRWAAHVQPQPDRQTTRNARPEPPRRPARSTYARQRDQLSNRTPVHNARRGRPSG